MALKPTTRFSNPCYTGLLIAVIPQLLGCNSSDSSTTRPNNPPSKSSQSANSSLDTDVSSRDGKAYSSKASSSSDLLKSVNSSTQPIAKGLVPDNGKTIWVRPTAGPTLDLFGIAEGAETILLIRPNSLLAQEEGKRFWQALGPAGTLTKNSFEEEAGKPLSQIDRLVVSFGPGEEYGEPLTTVMVDPKKRDEIPLLRRELELLADALDDDTHVNFLFSPNFLLGDGGALFLDQWKPIRELLTDLAGEDWQAASLSLHLGERFYWELRVVGTAATRESDMARSLGKESAGWPKQITELVAQQDWPSYSRTIINRSPQMMSLLANYARYGTERRQTILNGYLPGSAAHNLALGGELLLAGLGQTNGSSSPVDSVASVSQTLVERLKTPISLQFRRESLETALQLLSDATNIPITLGGRDLQLEGITRNQMLELDQEQKPASEVLVEILRRANPDPLATGPTDERQKLVYVLRRPESDKGSLNVTTRSAAKSRGEELPLVFQPALLKSN